ncbi:MAG: hypothetical protein MI747_24360 [Desulfobacterales bacterium]|nr:hypothetical protein [Desulfobacterales bacterium]
MTEKKFKQVCTCENCGNEAEMIVTCEWVEVEEESTSPGKKTAPQKLKGTGTCAQCGNEAETWVDL